MRTLLRCKHSDTIEGYKELTTWTTRYKADLEQVIKDLELTFPSQEHPTYTIHYAPDMYEAVQFAFSIIHAVLQYKDRIVDKELRDALIRKQAGRDFLFHKLPVKPPRLLVPPYTDELDHYLDIMCYSIADVLRQRDLLSNLRTLLSVIPNDLKTATPVFSADKELPFENAEFQRLFHILLTHFKDYLFVLAGWYTEGLKALDALFRKNVLTKHGGHLSLHTSMTDLLEDSPHGPWFQALSRYRKNQWKANERDADAMRLVLALNRELIPQHHVVFLVSDAECIQSIVRLHESEARLSLHNRLTTSVLRTNYYFQTYRHIANDVSTPDFYSVAYNNALSERDKIQEFEEWRPQIEEMIKYNRALEEQGYELEEGSCPYADVCPFADHEDAYQSLAETVTHIKEIRNEIENIKFISKPFSYLEPFLQLHETTDEQASFLTDIQSFLKKQENEEEWEQFLDKQLQALQEMLQSEFLALSSEGVPFVEKYTEEMLESFMHFPFRIYFSNPILNGVAKKLEITTDERTWGGAQESHEIAKALRPYLRALIDQTTQLPDSDPEKHLVWALVLFAYQRLAAALSILDSWLDKSTLPEAIDQEFRYLKAQVAISAMDTIDPLNTLNQIEETIVRYPQHFRMKHIAAFAIGTFYLAGKAPPGYDLSKAREFCNAALKSLDPNTDLAAACHNNCAYLSLMDYEADPTRHDLLNAAQEHVDTIAKYAKSNDVRWRPPWLDTSGWVSFHLARHELSLGHREKAKDYLADALQKISDAEKLAIISTDKEQMRSHLRAARQLRTKV